MPEAERPARVVFLIITDGHANSSTEATLPMVKKAIKHQTAKYGWEFAFIGSTLDARTREPGWASTPTGWMRKLATAEGECSNDLALSASLTRSGAGPGSASGPGAE